jgi:HrpA-like RNA helicase
VIGISSNYFEHSTKQVWVTAKQKTMAETQKQNSVNQLKIYDHLGSIVKLIGEHPISGILAPTGYGKSIGIPWILARQGVKVFVSVPTRASAISLSETLKFLDPSISVGYAAEGNIKYDQDSMVVYATSGHMKKKMIRHFDQGVCDKIDFATVLILDEYHLQSVDDNVIEALWNTCARSGVQVPRLVLASADLDREKYRESVYEIDAETYPIQIIYHNRDYDLDNPQIFNDLSDKIREYHQSNTDGHFLVFVSGSSEVESVQHSLGDLSNALVLPAYSNLSNDQIRMIFEPASPGIRKIIIATNIAETSITIENIGVVFDTLREKRPETSMTGGLRLSSHFISKQSANQRTGRTGRTGPGISYRMMTEKQFNKLEDRRPPELTRVPIYETIMELLDVGLNPVTILSHLTSQKMNSATQLLKKLGMVDNNNHVTDIGHFAPQFPLSVRNVAILWHWIQKGFPIFPAIVTLAMIDSYGPSYMWYPPKKETQTQAEYSLSIEQHRASYFEKFSGRSDVHTFLNIWHDLMDSVGGMDGTKSKRRVAEWSNQNSMNNRKIREVITIVKQSINAARKLGYQVQIGPFTTEGVIEVLRPFAEQAYDDLIMELNARGSRITYRHQLSRTSYILEGQKSVNQLLIDPPQHLIGLITIELPTRTGNLHIISIALDLITSESRRTHYQTEAPVPKRTLPKSTQTPPRKILMPPTLTPRYPATAPMDQPLPPRSAQLQPLIGTPGPLQDRLKSIYIPMVTPPQSVTPSPKLSIQRNLGERKVFAGFEHLSEKVLEQVLGNGWKILDIREVLSQKYIDLMFLEGKYRYDKRFYNYRCWMKSVVEASTITNKVKFHEIMLSYAPQYVTRSYIIPPNMAGPPQKPEGIWIWRPEEGYAGRGIEVIETQEDLSQAWLAREEARKSGKIDNLTEQRVLLSEYIVDPVLFQGKKFHLRLYFLVVATPTSRRSALYKQGEIVVAKLPYVKGDYNNKDVHDTHFKGMLGYQFPQDYPYPEQVDKILTETHAALTTLSQFALPTVKPYPESESGFEILGADVMIDTSEKIYILEINTKPSFIRNDQTRIDWLSRFLFEGVNEFALHTPGNDPGQLNQVIPCLNIPA